MVSVKVILCILLISFKVVVACSYTESKSPQKGFLKSVHSRYGRYSKCRILYNVNSSATFQLKLLTSGDINPNPGPTEEKSARIHHVPRLPTGERIVYDKSFLLQCNPAWKHLQPETLHLDLNKIIHRTNKNRGKVSGETWSNIKELGIQISLRGKRGGQRFRTRMKEKLPSQIPTIITLERRQAHPVPVCRNYDNLKSLVKCEKSVISSSNVNVCLWNAHSIRNKTTHLVEFIVGNDIDVMVLTESWLNSEDDVIVGECTPPGYTLLNAPRDSTNRGGGIAVVFKIPLNLLVKQVHNSAHYSTFEYLHVTDRSGSIHFVIVYRPPPSVSNGYTVQKFLEEFDVLVQEISASPGKLMLLGDFNLHWENPLKTDVQHVMNTTNGAGLVQQVQGSTHILGHTLDLVFCREECMLNHFCIHDNHISDHHMICFTLEAPKPSHMYNTVTLRNYRKLDKDKFANSLKELVSSKPDNVNSDLLFEFYTSGTKELIDVYAPSESKTKLVKPRMPWLNESTLLARQERRRMERKWRKTRLDSDRRLFIKANAHVCDVIQSAKEEYFKEKLRTSTVKDVFAIIQFLLNRKTDHLPTHFSAQLLSSQFSSFFVEKIEKIREEIDLSHPIPNMQFEDKVNEGISLFETFELVTPADLSKVIMSCSNATCRLDPIPTWLLKDNVEHLLPLLTDIVNTSLSTGVFPKEAHSAIIKPTLKSTTLNKNELKSYRPVSNLSFVGKLTEKVACNQLNKHMESNCLFDSFQSAYRPKHSVESALIRVKNDIMFDLNSDRVVLMVLLDLSAAFDTIDHDIFVSRLSSRIGVRSVALSWFKSYLSGWSSQVDILGKLSSPKISDFGLPQGSVVGPVAYSIYTLPVGDIARHHSVNYHLYADDTQLYVSFDPKIPGDLENALDKLQRCVSDIRNWMMVNKLKLNDAKTEFFIASSPHNYKKLPNLQLEVGDMKIDPSEVIRNLGVLFDRHMTMSNHISSVCRTVTHHLRNITRIRRFIDKPTSNHAIRSLILSRLDYCNGLLSSIPNTQLARLQRLQNWAARLVFLVRRDTPPDPLLCNLHWLPVKQRIIFKLLLFVYKSLNNYAPQYLLDCLKIYVPGKRTRSSQDPLKLTYPTKRKLTGDRTFTVTSSIEWNKLPLSLRQSPSVETFKKSLKTYLF